MKRTARLAKKVLITILGAFILLMGLAMLVLPGPGTLATVLGLLVLSLEYEWARRHSQRAKEYARRIADETVSHRWSFVLSALSSTAMVVLGVILTASWGLAWVGLSLAVSGVLALATLAFSYAHARRS